MRARNVVWRPAPGWPAAPPGWQFWVPAEPVIDTTVRISDPTRRSLVLETWVVMIAFLLPWVVSAVVVLGNHLATGASLSQLPSFDRHQAAINIVLGLISYTPTAAVVPLALFLLARTGQGPAVLG